MFPLTQTNKIVSHIKRILHLMVDHLNFVSTNGNVNYELVFN